MAGMKGFVETKHADSQGARQSNAPRSKKSNNDLKLPTPKTTSPAANTAQARTGNTSTRLQSDSRNGKRDSTEDRPFYGTDVSNADASSTASSARSGRAGVTNTAQYAQMNGTATGAVAGNFADGSDDGSAGEAIEPAPHGIGSFANPAGGEMSESMRQILIERGDSSFANKYVPGDSYPPTTSGNPSIAESNGMKVYERNSRATAQAAVRGRQAPQINAPVSGPSEHDRHQRHRATHEAEHNRSTYQGGYFVKPQARDDQSIEHLKEQFSFAKPNLLKAAAQPSTKNQAQPSVQKTESHPPLSSNLHQKTTVPSFEDDGHITHQVPGRTYSTIDRFDSEHHYHGSSKMQKMQIPARAKHDQQASDRARNHEQYSEGDGREINVQDGLPHGQFAQLEVIEPDGIVLDYDPEKLVGMDYHEVKQQSFDVDPNDEGFKFADEETNLDKRITAVAALVSKDQSQFFASLPIDEWEQAGDWFITRFGEVLNKLKTNRKHTREAAQAYESEIEERHSAVSKKRKQIDDELAEMRQSGGKVLQGTPKKSKTK